MTNKSYNKFSKYKRAFGFLLLLSVITISNSFAFSISKKESVKISPPAFSVNIQSVASQDRGVNPINDYKLNITSQNTIVVEMGRGMILYSKNADDKISFPAASKIMTAIIALETIPLDSKVTISKVASSQNDASTLSLNNGEKYSLEYLLYGMILKDNNAAAIAISEQISGVESEFVKLMNNKAASYQMAKTKFENATGILSKNQYTTINDVSRLVRFAMTSTDFATIFKTKDIPFFLSTNKTKHLINNFSRALDLVDNTTGVFLSSSDSQHSFMSTFSFDDMNFVIIGSSTSKNKIIDDLTTVSSSIYSDYESSFLVLENQKFPKSLSIGTDTIDLIFKQSIRYIHPKGNDFIASTIYEENAIIEYPIQTTKSTGKVTFELLDDTKISADLYPIRTVWGESSIYLKILGIYDANRDIGILVLIAICLFILLLIHNIGMFIIKIFRHIFRIPKSKEKTIDNSISDDSFEELDNSKNIQE